MSLFPDRPLDDAGSYLDAYVAELTKAWASVSRDAVTAAERVLAQSIAADATIFACGNGGSAAISNHLLCDWLKGVQTGTGLKPRVHSLSSAPELMTAIGNDIGFSDIFAFQLRSLGKAGDVLVAVSSSGSSPNIIAAVQTARSLGMQVIALTGFDGGPAVAEADVSLHVTANNYGVIEDVHQSLMHVLAQSLRMGGLTDPSDLGRVRF